MQNLLTNLKNCKKRLNHVEDNFKTFSKYYDILYSLNAYEDKPGELKFFLKEAKKAKGKVLEVGCGTGRIYLPLLAAGIPIEGIDLSQEMLDILKEKSFFYKGKVTVKKMNMLKLKYHEKYKLIIIPLNSIHHLKEIEQLSTFLNFYDALEKGGKIIFTNQFYSKEILNLSEYTFVHRYEHESFGIRMDLYLKSIRDKKILKEKFIIKDSTLKKPITLELPDLYHFRKKEIRTLLEESGFKKIKFYQDFAYTPHRGRSDLGVWVAQKPK